MFTQGDLVQLEARFSRADVAPHFPDEVVLRIRRPDDVVIEHKLSDDSNVVVAAVEPGLFYAHIDTADGPGGTWIYQFASTGPSRAVERSSFTLRSAL